MTLIFSQHEVKALPTVLEATCIFFYEQVLEPIRDIMLIYLDMLGSWLQRLQQQIKKKR